MKNRIKALRAERGWSQSDLAARVGVSRNSIGAVETGRFDPSLPLAFAISDAFGLSIEEIFLRDAPAGAVEDPSPGTVGAALPEGAAARGTSGGETR